MDPRRIADILRTLARGRAIEAVADEMADMPVQTLRTALEEAARILADLPAGRRERRRGGKALVLRIDGAARGNPGPAGIGVVLSDEEGQFREEHSLFLGEATNNVAEYEALLFGLRRAKELGYALVQIYSDSELLVRQIQGAYRVKHPRLQELYGHAQVLLKSFQAVRIEHVDRDQNTRADLLANRAIDTALQGRGVSASGQQR
ncbi:MAG: ribonuclease HI family protein [Candidatus Methylomirabilales bacterium]